MASKTFQTPKNKNEQDLATPSAIATESGSQPQQNSHDDIRCRAYEKWIADGCPSCDGVSYWLEAEKELNGH